MSAARHKPVLALPRDAGCCMIRGGFAAPALSRFYTVTHACSHTSPALCLDMTTIYLQSRI